jgi:hypothetical protein
LQKILRVPALEPPMRFDICSREDRGFKKVSIYAIIKRFK